MFHITFSQQHEGHTQSSERQSRFWDTDPSNEKVLMSVNRFHRRCERNSQQMTMDLMGGRESVRGSFFVSEGRMEV